ncbi:MAG: hypothetical protein ACRDLF_02575 [Solirubrobacteraceae bacterium]
MSLSQPMFAFILEIGPHLEGAVLGSFLIVTVGGCLGAWRHDGPPRNRSLGGLLFGEDELPTLRDDRREEHGDGPQAAEPE